ncbi:MAG TPA: pyridoxal phosphate-dependent aminotransferase, partial [Negativicutes bacterium]|nr:pyridoxal phosphate-dependent aminotransferase [Negativicutes bacterium]
ISSAEGGEREALLKLSQGVKDLISLGRGDPDLDTPKHIAEAGINAILQGKTHYTHWAGIPELREEISKKLKKDNNLNYSIDEIVTCVGVEQAMFIVLMALLEPGDEVIMGDPHYTSYGEIINIVGGKQVVIPTFQEDNFALRPSEIEKKITDKTKLLVVITPNNPTGAVIGADTLEEIAKIAVKHNLLVISDEIYEKMIFDEDFKHVSIATFPGMRERTIVFNGFSKCYSMTGWRIGYFAAPRDFTEKLEVIMHSMIINAPTISQYAALEALKSSDDCVKETKAIYKQRRDVLKAALDRTGMKYSKPVGGMYMWVNVKDLNMTSFEFCKRLLLESRVLVFPGTVYGGGEGYVRISLLAPTEKFIEGVARIERFINSLK